uniref:ACT domain-containing protein n=1 Tax=Rhizochromulina marina TaxID=1034831 RepID=A0A7S2SL09_9STRA
MAAAGRDQDYADVLERIRAKHETAVDELLQAQEADRLKAVVERDLGEIRDILRAVVLTRGESETLREIISGYGELWSTQIMTALLNQNGENFHFVDARRVLRVVDTPLGTEVMWEESKALLDAVLEEAGDRNIAITGYIASTQTGGATTLKRDGSDFSASIFGRLLGASEINIWTDVDGVLSADPRRVPDAQVLPEVSYNEAIELAYFGAKVIHPKTMLPAISARIPIFIKNTFNPEASGTRIFVPSELTVLRKSCVAGFSTIDNIALVNVAGTGMIGVCGVTQRIFNVLAHANVHVQLICQASSEHSLCFAVKLSDMDRVKKELQDHFSREVSQGQLSAISTVSPCSIVAVVGDGMSSATGVSGRVFDALGKAHVNVVSIAQGCDERNISIVVHSDQTERALRAMHSAFLLSEITVSVGIIFDENDIAKNLVDLLTQRRGNIQTRFSSDLRVRGIASATKMLLSTGEPLGAADSLDASSEPVDFEKFVSHIQSDHLPHALIVDCTNNASLAQHHVSLLARGVHVVTANIHALAGPLTSYNQIMSERRLGKTHYGFEVSIAGGIPIQAMLKPIVHGGDEVTAVAAVFSSSISHVMGRIRERSAGLDSPHITFSAALAEAVSHGMTEHDPLDDIVGKDSLHKLLVMARELGLALTEEDVHVEPAVPVDELPPPTTGDGSAATRKWSVYDQVMRDKMESAASRGNVLQYVARLNRQGDASIRREEVPAESNMGQLPGGNICVCLWTHRYAHSPLVVQGPLGTPSATASGLLADILRLVSELGGRDRGPNRLRRTPSMEALATPGGSPSNKV